MECDASRYQDVIARIDATPRSAEPQKAWDLVIAGYLYFGGLGAGAFIMVTVAGWFGFSLTPSYVTPVAGWTWDWSQLLVLWGPFATALGASLLVFHLGRNRRLFYTAGNNPRTSWMARGFSILASFIVVGCLIGAVSAFAPSLPEQVPTLWRVVETLSVGLAVGTAIYTGILVRSMQFIPAWRSPLIPFLFLASALSTGAMGVVLGATVFGFIVSDPASAHRLAHFLELVELGLIVIEASILVFYVRHLLRGKPEAVLSANMWLSGSWRFGFWGGIVGLALAGPFAVDAVNLDVRSEVLAIVASTCVLIGGFLLRVGILGIGIKETPPLYRLTTRRAVRAGVARYTGAASASRPSGSQ